MSQLLSHWLEQEVSTLANQTMRRAPNLLPDREELHTYINIIARCVDEDRGTQLSLIQFWVSSHLGQDQALATDWLTVIRVMKEVVWDHLPPELMVGINRQDWRILDRIFTYTVVEMAQLVGNADHSIMLAYMNDLRQQMEVLEKSKANFLAVAAHELKTPLTILEGYSNMLRMEIPPENTRLSLLLNGFNNGTRRLQEIINDMIDVTMIDNRSYAISFQPMYLAKVIEMAANELSSSFANRNVRLIIGEVLVKEIIYGDPTRLFQAINKILGNGLKYTPDGGTVEIRTELVRQHEQSEDIKGYIDIQIRDTGIGIDAEDLLAIFERFVVTNDVALHSSGKTKFKGGGPGLGLPIAQGIVVAHGGRVWAESPGCDEEACPGSVFHIELPIRVQLPVGVEF